jgi:hypothetical protein
VCDIVQFLFVHANARNQKVFEYYQANGTCGPKTVPTCDWMAQGWTKWVADLATSTHQKQQHNTHQKQQAGGGYGGRGWDVPVPATAVTVLGGGGSGGGTAATKANPPLKVVLLVNVGHPQNSYPNHGPWDGPNSTKNPWGPAGRLTLTTWASLGLDDDDDDDEPEPGSGSGYTARDVFTQELLPVNASGFVANVSGFNATLVLISRQAKHPSSDR